MVAHFCWVKSRMGTIEPQLYYGDRPKGAFTSGFKILQSHRLTEEDYTLVDAQRLVSTRYDDPPNALDILAKRYPAPDYAEE